MPMPIDFNKLDKPKVVVLALALASAVVATVLVNVHITKSIEEGAGSMQLQDLHQKIQELEQANRDLIQRQAGYANRVEQELNKLISAQQEQPVQQAQEDKVSVKPQSLAINTPSGKRALTVNVETLAAVGGLLNPGDFVDVLVHLTLPSQEKAVSDLPPDKQTTKTTITLFQNIQILAIGANVSQPADFDGQQKSSSLIITFAVDPQQAELMTFAEAYGKLQLALRSPGERAAYQLPSANWETFTEYLEATQGVMIEPPVSLRKPEAPKKNPPPEPEIKIYRGGQ